VIRLSAARKLPPGAVVDSRGRIDENTPASHPERTNGDGGQRKSKQELARITMHHTVRRISRRLITILSDTTSPSVTRPGLRRATLAAALLAQAAGLSVPSAAVAQQGEEPEQQEQTEGGGIVGSLDRVQASLSETVLKTADNIDGFFATERYQSWLENKSNVRVRLNVDPVENAGTQIGAELKIHLVLPGTSGRLRFVANDDDDGDESAGRGEDFSDETSLALRYLGVQTDKWSLSVDLGVRIKDSDLGFYPRLNVVRTYTMGEKWAGRSEGRFYYYTDTGGRVDLRQYFERKISKSLFFRSRTRAQWFDEEGSDIFPEQRFTLFQSLSYKSALAYEALARTIPESDSVFDPEDLLVEPQDKYNQFQVRLRYRRNVWRPWFYFEVWPIVADTTLAARLRLEVTFGHVRPAQARLGE
jgi:hypothetical protein